MPACSQSSANPISVGAMDLWTYPIEVAQFLDLDISAEPPEDVHI